MLDFEVCACYVIYLSTYDLSLPYIYIYKLSASFLVKHDLKGSFLITSIFTQPNKA